jgi:XTP/dITP diphosphohydrolase
LSDRSPIDRPKIDRLVVASKNPDKIAEIEAILVQQRLVGEIAQGLDWQDISETGSTLEQNALLKARTVATVTGLPALADDTGLEVFALGGAPGVQTARFAGPNATYAENVTKLLTELNGVTNRDAEFVSVVALVYPLGVELVAHGRLTGTIALKPRGDHGFGYDPVFVIGDRTLAELSPEVKNKASHRARALLALAEMIRRV